MEYGKCMNLLFGCFENVRCQCAPLNKIHSAKHFARQTNWQVKNISDKARSASNKKAALCRNGLFSFQLKLLFHHKLP